MVDVFNLGSKLLLQLWWTSFHNVLTGYKFAFLVTRKLPRLSSSLRFRKSSNDIMGLGELELATALELGLNLDPEAEA